MEQRTSEWFEARRGKATSSRFGDVLAKGKGVPFGKTAYSYAYEIIAEEMTGTHREFSNQAIDWGTENEGAANIAYQMETFTKVTNCGFIDITTNTDLNGFVGGSPDGLIGNHGIIEIKCPFNSSIHVKTLAAKVVPKEYIPQVQGNLMVTGRDYCDFISYDPRFKTHKIVVVRVGRDKEYIEKLLDRLREFRVLVCDLKEKING